MPYTTAGAVTRNQQPRRKRPASNCSRPANSRIGPSIATPCWRTSSNTSTARPAAGPLTCNGEPASQPTTMPPMIPVIRPLAGGMPEAMAMPMHKGRATRNTTTEASNSRGKAAFTCVLFTLSLLLSRFMAIPMAAGTTPDTRAGTHRQRAPARQSGKFKAADDQAAPGRCGRQSAIRGGVWNA
ncbi:hypothetical protein D3C85_1420770 [compost metagenome]